MNSNNMNYFFNVEYYDGIEHLPSESDEDKEKIKKSKEELKRRNQALQSFKFKDISGFNEWENIMLPGFEFRSFELNTTYPGLLIGTGNPHAIAVENAIKCGFSFDYVTGLPYIPGSSLKGIIRSMFPEDEPRDKDLNEEKTNLIKDMLSGILNKEFVIKNKDEIVKLRNNIFENGDIFLGAFPVVEEGKENILKLDYITPHKEPLKNPVPINIVKIGPNVKIKFCFVLKDYDKDYDKTITATVKNELFKELVLISGVGAKTNVGFGALSKMNKKINL